MDYKAFSSEFEIIKKELLDFIKTKNRLNIERVDGSKDDLGIVKTYLKDIEEGNYSLKSYKAKIIHNELEHTKTQKELELVLSSVDYKIDALLNQYFDEYLATVKEEITSPTKQKDLKDFSTTHRREKQDINNKKNALEKEIVEKNKDFDNLIIQKGKEFVDKSNDFKNKIQSELNKINEVVIKEYAPFETELIDINEKNKISEINKKINEIRLKGIEKEYNLKLSSYDELYSLEKEHINTKNDLLLEKEKYNLELKKKILDLDNKLNRLTLELDNKERNYDAITESENINHCYEEIDIFVQLLTMINTYIDSFNNRDNDDVMLVDKLFVFDFIVLYLDYLLIFVRSNNVYDSLARIILDIIPIATGVKEETFKLIKEQNANHQNHENELKEALKDYDPHSRKVTKEEFLDNVIQSLDRYYNNFYNEVDKFNMIMFERLIGIANTIRENLNKLIPLENNNRLLPTNFMELSSKYKYVNINDYIGLPYTPSVTTDENGNTITFTREELITDFANKLKSNYTERKEKITVVMNNLEKTYNDVIKTSEIDYNNKINKNSKDLKLVIVKYDKLKEKELNDLNKNTNLNKVSAKKIYLESLKQISR